ncbi:MAG: hypothetical protein V4510_00260 [bacterium]
MPSIPLTDDEAFVLFDWLQNFSDTGSVAFRDQAEKRALWNLCSVLERELAPFQADYPRALQAAQERLRDGP